VSIAYYVGREGPVTVEVADEKNGVIRRLTAAGSVGFHTLNWDVRYQPPVPAPPKSKGKAATVVATPELKYSGF
jgi:hypothetical protein